MPYEQRRAAHAYPLPDLGSMGMCLAFVVLQWGIQTVQSNTIIHKFEFKYMIKAFLLLLLLAAAYSQTGSIQITPITPTLWAQSSYSVSFYTFNPMPSTATFSLNFSATYITIPSGSLNVSAVANTSAPAATASCSGAICTLKLNKAVPANTKIVFTVGSFTNPYFLRAQPITANVTFNSTYTEYPSWTIPVDQYTPMAITSNSLTQSDYGVGNTEVNYIFNFSVPMSPPTVQLSLTLPPQVSVGTLQTSLVYLGVVQYAIPVTVNNFIVLTFTTPSNPTTSYAVLNVSGLVNPQSMGNSSSFALQILLPNLPGTTASCSNCAVAQITSSLFAQSTVPGNIQTLKMFSSNSLIGQQNSITIYSKLYASIPAGGIYQILLPSSVKPVLPVVCSPLYGFTLTSGSASCSYNSTINAIFTNNFVFSGSGSVILSVTVINPPDTTQAGFYFQSFDSTGNMIGSSITAYNMTATPLPLNSTAVKTNYQVESLYRLTVNCTLGVALTSSNKIQVILPQATYNTSSITCSVGTTVPCTTSIDPLSQNLTITLSPPCSPCSVGTSFTFAVDGLTNPSFINAYSQAVIIQSATATGTIETNSLSLALSPSTLTIGNYSRSGSNSVGSFYSMSFTYTVSNYVSQNGGILLISFNQFDAFVNPVANPDGSYDYPVAIAVSDPQGNQYSNSLTYYTTSSPNSLQEIAINICGGSNCAGSITISGLRKGFNPLSSLTQSIQITTVYGDSVSTSTFNIMQFNVAKASKPLSLSLTNSVTTLSSNYVLDFVSSCVPFQSGLSFSLSALHTINGGCFLTHNGSIFNGAFTCQVLNSTSVSLSYSGDPTLMMLETIDYTLSIINVTNPISVIPLTYQLVTQFSSAANLQFTLTYAIQTALPLNFLVAKSNNTFGQNALLNITIVSKYPSFNEIKINAGSALMTVLTASSSSTAYQSAMVNNVYQVSQIYSLSNQSVLLNIVNPNNCGIAGNISFSMHNAGYLSATGSITINNVSPMFLGLSTVTSSRTVGDTTNLTVTFLRVNSYTSESEYRLNISSSLYDYSAALYNNTPVAFPIAVPIGLTTITITNLKNLLYVPNTAPSNGIVAWTIDGASVIVALTSYSPANLVPNTAATAIGSSFTRTNTVINGVGAITINYTPRFPTSTSIMSITLPLSQSTLVSPACSMQGASNSAASCSVISSNSTSITLNFYNQTSTTLTNVVNVEPNSNQLKVTMFTANNELVETATGTITPTIQYNQLTLSGSVSTAIVATVTQIQLTITSPSPIDIGSKVVINFPPSTFSKPNSLSSQDCTYTIAGVNYTGCAYAQQGAWLSQVNITALGASQLPSSTPIVLTVYAMNAWSVTAFAALGLTILVSNPSDSFVAQGSISLATIYGGIPSLIPSAVGNATFTQTSTQANANNSVTASFTLGIPLTTGTTLMLWLPKSAYTLSASNSALIANMQSQTQNSTYYSIAVSVVCSQTAPLCNLAGNTYTITVPLQNNPYSQIQNSPIAFQVQLSGNAVSTQLSLPLQSFTPQSLTSSSSTSILRSNIVAFANTNVTITVPNPSTVSSFTLMVAPLVKPTATLPLVTSPTFAGLSSSQSLTFQLNSSNYLLISVSGASGPTSSITVSGQNNMLVCASESYQLTVMDSKFVYFTGQVTPADVLVPYSSGLSLQRIVTTVGKSTSIYLYGTLPTAVPALSVAFNGNNYTVSGSTFNVSLGTMVNNNNVSDASTYNITIKNSDFTAFSSKLPIFPSLTTQNLTALLGISMPDVVNVSSSFNITVKLASTALSFLSIKTPPYFNSLTKCCIDSACAQTFIQSCTFTTQGGNNLVQLWLSSPQLLNNVDFQVTALDYQQSFTNQTVSVISALPTSSITVESALTIAAVNISSTLSLLSWKVNAINAYTLNVQPIAKAGYIQIALPVFLSAQLVSSNNSDSYTLTVNGSVIVPTVVTMNGASTLILPVTPASTKLSLLLSSIANPPDNTPYSISVTQSADLTQSSVFGYSSLGFSMNQFDLITITSAIRLVTKVNVATNIIIQATAPYNSSQFIITFPPSQLLTTSSCSITANENTALPCQVINSSSILTSSLAGNNRYTITGLQNQKYYSANSTQDQLSAQIGSPYTRATSLTSSSTFVSPRLTLGSIVVNSMTSSSVVMLASTKLTYNITIENTNNINGFIIMFSTAYYYIFSPSITCKINSAAIPCSAIDNQTLFLEYANPTTSNLIVTISNILNFVQPTDWTFKSVQTILTGGVTTYSDVDLYYNDGASMSHLQSSPLAMRIILPYNYVQSSPVSFQAIIDSQFGSFLPLKLFSFNFTTHTSSCEKLGSPFASTLSFSCSFPQSTNYNMKLQLYHSKFPSIPLAVGATNMFIYPTPGGGCNNQMCDSCSTANGQEYCFACRQGMYSSNGQCSGNCASGSFPYSTTNICQSCSPTCSNCFGLYDTNCLSCSNTSLALNSGSCVNSCPLPTYSYNGVCVTSEQCTGATGCRLCSDTGFCYQCLPDYTGEPTCRYVNVMPPTIMVYFLAPVALLAIVSIIIAAAKCVGAESLLSQTVFSFSMVELFAWAFTVPVMPNVMTAMVLVAFFTLRIIISIVSYEVFYKKNMGELSQKLLEEESQKEIEASQDKKEEVEGSHLHNWKTKLVRLTAHFNGPDSYELLKCRIAEPVLIVSSSLAIDAIFMANRWVVCFLMFYMASVGTVGDSVLMPIMVIATASLLTVCRLLAWDKLRKCLSSCRS